MLASCGLTVHGDDMMNLHDVDMDVTARHHKSGLSSMLMSMLCS
jgi:hypothetical protein